MNLSEYQKWTNEVAIYWDLSYPRLGLAEECGELLGLFAKANRDNIPLDYDKIKKEAGDVLWMLTRICHDLDIDMQDVLEYNVAKLESRKQRDVIKGSGDDR